MWQAVRLCAACGRGYGRGAGWLAPWTSGNCGVACEWPRWVVTVLPRLQRDDCQMNDCTVFAKGHIYTPFGATVLEWVM